MGKLVDGVWRGKERYTPDTKKGAFVRAASTFRDQIGDPRFPAEAGRYHLYVSYACPWAHRALIFRALKGLEELISLSVVHPEMLDDGWRFDAAPGVIPDEVNGARYLHEVYTRADANFTGRVTVPVLWDKVEGTIVNNESSEIIRMFNRAFDGLGAKPGDYYPEPLRAEIDAINERVYRTVNNGVYRCGFASTQAAYEEAFDALFESLDWLEALLGTRRYLAGDQLTEADWRLFTTMLRFDPVYVGHFKCNLRRLVDYPNLLGHTRELYQHPGVRETVRFDHIKQHYYRSHTRLNPSRIVPRGPLLDLDAPHGRG